jgi:hypothetical protein
MGSQLTSVKTDANSPLIFNLGNDLSQFGKLGAELGAEGSCP